MQGDIELRRYLLGALTEREHAEIDLRLIEGDESLEEAIALAEHELLEDLLEGNLSGEEKLLFDANFIMTDERARELGQIKLLAAHARNSDERGLVNSAKASRA